jgi:nitroreductase
MAHADIEGPSAAVQNLLLMAHVLGYGACWMTGPLLAGGALQELLGISAPDELLAVIPVGRCGQLPLPPARKKQEEIVSVIE